MSEADDLQRRAETFADAMLRFIQGLPKTPMAQRIANQLQDSSSSVGANYRAARRGRSHAEFTAKIGVVSEEADESIYWLERLINANIRSDVPTEPLLEEAVQLAKIFGASKCMPTRSQQLGLIILLAVLVLYVIARVGW